MIRRAIVARRLVMRGCILRSLGLCAITTTTLFAATTTQPANLEEWFVANGGVRANAESASLVRYDPETGQRSVIANWGERPPDVRRLFVLNSQGKTIELNRIGNDPRDPTQGRWTLKTQTLGASRRIFEEVEIKEIGSAALSPDASKLVWFDYAHDILNEEDKLLAIGDDTHVHQILTKHCAMDLFSWNANSTQVAFYFTDCDEAGEIAILRHGVAILTVDGQLREVLPLSQAIRTPNLFAKFIPPSWDPTGEFVYYTNGVPASQSPPRPDRSYAPCATYRVNVNTGESEFIAHGAFSDISPDGKYVLLYPCPKATPDGKWTRGTGKVDTKTKQVTYLPDEVKRPRISPSGKLVACTGRSIYFYQTSDWKPYGKSFPGGMDGEVWAKCFRWIIVDEQSPFYKPQSQPAP